MTRRGPVETVQAVRDAQAAVEGWDAALWLEVVSEAPECLQDVDTMTWAVTVQAFKTDGEPILAAAKRLALYLDLHAENYGRPPRLLSVRDHAIQARVNSTLENLDRTIQET